MSAWNCDQLYNNTNKKETYAATLHICKHNKYRPKRAKWVTAMCIFLIWRNHYLNHLFEIHFISDVKLSCMSKCCVVINEICTAYRITWKQKLIDSRVTLCWWTVIWKLQLYNLIRRVRYQKYAVISDNKSEWPLRSLHSNVQCKGCASLHQQTNKKCRGVVLYFEYFYCWSAIYRLFLVAAQGNVQKLYFSCLIAASCCENIFRRLYYRLVGIGAIPLYRASRLTRNPARQCHRSSERTTEKWVTHNSDHTRRMIGGFRDTWDTVLRTTFLFQDSIYC
jgi:hypothetical protein